MYMLIEKKRHYVPFKKFKKLAGNWRDHKLKAVRIDRGKELLSQNFSKFCKKEGIKRQLTVRTLHE